MLRRRYLASSSFSKFQLLLVSLQCIWCSTRWVASHCQVLLWSKSLARTFSSHSRRLQKISLFSKWTPLMDTRYHLLPSALTLHLSSFNSANARLPFTLVSKLSSGWWKQRTLRLHNQHRVLWWPLTRGLTTQARTRMLIASFSNLFLPKFAIFRCYADIFQWILCLIRHADIFDQKVCLISHADGNDQKTRGPIVVRT